MFYLQPLTCSLKKVWVCFLLILSSSKHLSGRLLTAHSAQCWPWARLKIGPLNCSTDWQNQSPTNWFINFQGALDVLFVFRFEIFPFLIFRFFFYWWFIFILWFFYQTHNHDCNHITLNNVYNATITFLLGTQYISLGLTQMTNCWSWGLTISKT